MPAFTTLLRQNKNYRYTWMGQVVSEIGDHFNNIAVFSLALAVTHSGLVVSGIMLARAVPAVMAGPLACVLLDRMDRKRIMIASDLVREIANLLTTHGIGQSTCISIGGDPVVGSDFLDLIPLFEEDPETKGLVIFCEPGGTGEERLAEYVFNHRPRLPMVPFVAGQFVDEMPGVRFGHAGAIVEGDRGSTKGKIEKFRWAGIEIAERFSEIVDLIKMHL